MKESILVGLGGFMGANVRYFVSTFVAKNLDPALPWGTLAVNVTGSFIIGMFLVWTTERVLTDPAYRLLVAVGFCGAYTTFSSYAFETVRLMEQGHFLLAIGNFLTNNLLAVLGALAGITLARSI
ncbi:MAG: fluoride efflux transporter CrcB [Pseudomonadota bacterium]